MQKHIYASCLAGSLVVLSFTLLFNQTALAVNPPTVQTFYVPLPEDQVFQALRRIHPGDTTCDDVPEVQSPMSTYLSIAPVASGTVLYYDHWEDGFESNLTNPVQDTTEIWGDGDSANGFPPDNPADIITAGQIIILDNLVDISTLQEVIDFDGGDRFAASKTVAVTRAACASGSGTLLAGAVEVYDTNGWGTDFRVPIGENIASKEIFEYTSLLIMAAQNDTLVEIDADNDGAFETVITLAMGESHHIDGDVYAGAKIKASAPVQVDMITGNITGSQDDCVAYQSRWLTLFPASQWSDSYYNPVGTPTNAVTAVFLYNPGSDPITIEWESNSGLQPAISVLPDMTISQDVPNNTGTHFYTTDGSPFLAIAVVDADDVDGTSAHDWGFALIPEAVLTQQVLIGWGPGQDPLAPPSENGSPVWITPVLADDNNPDVAICIDFNGDGGPLVDPNGEGYDQLLVLNALASERVYDPDGDQTGMLLYICDDNQAKIAAAWGQDPMMANPGPPGIDVGTTIPPLPAFAAGKSATISEDANEDGLVNPGDSLTYTIIIQNISRVPIHNGLISDTVPLYTAYIGNSTIANDGITTTPIPDTGLTPFPLDEGGFTLNLLPANGIFTLTFQVTIDPILPGEVDLILNQAIVKAVDQVAEPEVETSLNFTNPAISLVKTAGPTADGDALFITEPGIVTYQYVISNTGDTYLSDMIIADDGGTIGNPDDDILFTETECPDLAGPLAPLATIACTIDIFVETDVINVATATGNPTDSNGNDLPNLDDVQDIDSAVVFLDQPSAITLLTFTARARPGHIVIAWETGVEIKNAGFNLYRAAAIDGPYTLLNNDPIPPKGNIFSGASYTYIDTTMLLSEDAEDTETTYYYKLEDIDIEGTRTLHGPISTSSSAIDQLLIEIIYLPLVIR